MSPQTFLIDHRLLSAKSTFENSLDAGEKTFKWPDICPEAGQLFSDWLCLGNMILQIRLQDFDLSQATEVLYHAWTLGQRLGAEGFQNELINKIMSRTNDPGLDVSHVNMDDINTIYDMTEGPYCPLRVLAVDMLVFTGGQKYVRQAADDLRTKAAAIDMLKSVAQDGVRSHPRWRNVVPICMDYHIHERTNSCFPLSSYRPYRPVKPKESRAPKRGKVEGAANGESAQVEKRICQGK